MESLLGGMKNSLFLYSHFVCFDLTVLIMMSCYKDGPGLGMGSHPQIKDTLTTPRVLNIPA